MLANRTEHNTKNRFFSILARFLSLPIRKLKKTKSYWNKEALQSIMDKILKSGQQESIKKRGEKTFYKDN